MQNFRLLNIVFQSRLAFSYYSRPARYKYIVIFGLRPITTKVAILRKTYKFFGPLLDRDYSVAIGATATILFTVYRAHGDQYRDGIFVVLPFLGALKAVINLETTKGHFGQNLKVF